MSSSSQGNVVDDNDLDPVESSLQRIGCLEKHWAVQECYADHKDWRKCQTEVKDFRDCVSKSKKVDSPNSAVKH
ncbi:hypothetical protein EB796_023385 [Bugula neritina]|uniref:COA4 n=1 Tax=Bugula neritina TaxID=10212 RepID=A0A7J7IWL4_BUGNE|nr:hypothetical protein EB796_023385 [Bugula neritina]